MQFLKTFEKFEIEKKEIASNRQLTTHLTKFLRDNGFKQVTAKSGENSPMGYHEDKEFMNADQFILVAGMKSLEEAEDMKKSLEKFFQDNFGEKIKGEKIISGVRETFIKGKQVYVEMHKKNLDEETLKTVRYDVVIYKNWKYWFR
jgi:hypothetical protein